MDTHGFDMDGQDHHLGDAEAALEALRAAISAPPNDLVPPHSATLAHPGSSDDVHAGESLSSDQSQTLERALSTIAHLQNDHHGMREKLQNMSAVAGVQEILDTLSEDVRLLEALASSLTSLLSNDTLMNIDPNLRSDIDDGRPKVENLQEKYDSLKVKFEGLMNRQRRGRKSANPKASSSKKPETMMEAESAEMEPQEVPSFPVIDEKDARRKRLMGLEHTIHKMANRRLGVRYSVKGFTCDGTTDLPEPMSRPPTQQESVNGVEEFRPDFSGDLNAPSVQPYIDKVVDDCMDALTGDLEIDMDRKKMFDSVAVYWTRLGKRYEEQQAHGRGELHKDELTRRKQNQYRRQQSLLARRVAAFDQSPLNFCRLRSLYRTLLTVDFAPKTEDRPDPNRSYSEEEWYAYQKLANNGRAPEAHEVVDPWWLAPNIRQVLTVLDVFAVDQASRIRRKGKPKAPAPTFHLAPELWDQSEKALPNLREKDVNGLPVSGGSGIVLFRFHVDPVVQAQRPEWAAGLYEDPPIPSLEANLPTLGEIMNSTPYSHLKPRVQAIQQANQVDLLLPEDVADVMSRPLPPLAEEPIFPEPDTSLDIASAEDLMSKNLEAFDAVLNSSMMSLSEGEGTSPLLQQGSSLRARRQKKRMASELPGGAATPVGKRLKEENGLEEPIGTDPEVDIQVDAAFLQNM